MKTDHMFSLIKLNLILNYEQFGNFTKFQRCVDRCAFKFENDFFYFNLLQSLNISAALNLSWEDTGIRWSFNLGNEVLPLPKKTIWSFKDSLPSEGIDTLIFSSSGEPLCIGVAESNIENNDYFNHFLQFSKLIDLSVRNIGFQKHFSGIDSYYCFNSFKWTEKSDFVFDSNLFRVSSRYSGYSYYIFEKFSGLYFQVKEQECAYVAATYLLNLDFNKIIKYENNEVIIHSSFRVPTFILRYLFSVCDRLIIGSKLVFQNVSRKNYDSLINYLTA